jgi:predicted DNA-binding mobile mystery protein A
LLYNAKKRSIVCIKEQKMGSNFSELKLRQIDATLSRWRAADLPPRPPSGWIKSIRDALGMTATHLAKRLGVATSTVTRLETSEVDDTISLSTLRRAAEALGCELQYSLVPKKTLADTLEARAATLARQQMSAISHTMALEAQSTSRETVDAQTHALAESLLKGSRRTLWRES